MSEELRGFFLFRYEKQVGIEFAENVNVLDKNISV